MVTATEAQDEVLPKLEKLVKLAWSGTGSKMSAYDAVGRKIGASGSWVRKCLGRQPVDLKGHVLLNIGAAYARLCTSIEAAADAAEASNALLREDLHAALQDRHPAPSRSGRAPSAAGAAARRPGRPPASALVVADAQARVPSSGGEALTDLPLWRAAKGGE